MRENGRGFSEIVKTLALELGFHAVGIAGRDDLLGLCEKTGLESHKRQFDLESALPGARSAICTAVSYLADIPEVKTANIAKFARSQDYHTVITKKLEQLAVMISNISQGFRWRSCVDTGPIFDRAAAYCAGLGSIGKNRCLFVTEYGSYVFLGELVTDLELESDSPAERDICGRCTLCLDACPTGALGDGDGFNRGLCLSHVTQNRSQPAEYIAEKLQGRIYGCDICQDACPLNGNARKTDWPEFLNPNPAAANPNLKLFSEMSDRDFELLFGKTAMHWCGKETISRNARIALKGRWADPGGQGS